MNRTQPAALPPCRPGAVRPAALPLCLAALRPAALLTLLVTAAASAQDKPLRAGLVGDPKPGETAPNFSAPYVSAAGPGPADQPFRLRAELGRRVVLVFSGPLRAGSDRRGWDWLAANHDSLTSKPTVVVGIVAGRSGDVQALATAVGGELKFLPDSGGRISRRFGVGKDSVPPSQWAVFVVGDDGIVAYRTRSFQFDHPVEVERLRKALAQ
ncbi:MAG: redoxin domain-containing protein [Gemmatimonadota bacterium]